MKVSQNEFILNQGQKRAIEASKRPGMAPSWRRRFYKWLMTGNLQGLGNSQKRLAQVVDYQSLTIL